MNLGLMNFDIISAAAEYEKDRVADCTMHQPGSTEIQRFYDDKALRAAYRHGFDKAMEIYKKGVVANGFGERYVNGNDGFIGTKQGDYITREGEPGTVLQQIDTKVIHVYRDRWLNKG